MKVLKGILIITFISLLWSCQNQKPISAMKKYFGEAPSEIISQSELAVAYHIAPFPDPNLSSTESFAQYPVLRGPIELYDEELANLKQIISDSSSYYLNDEIKMCVFTPNVGIEFIGKGDQSLQILISFDCNVIKLLDNDDLIFMEDIDPSRAALKEIFYPIFKEEPYFQALKQ